MTAPLNKGAKGRREHLASLPKGGGSRRLTEGFIRQKYKSSLQTQIEICVYYKFLGEFKIVEECRGD